MTSSCRATVQRIAVLAASLCGLAAAGTAQAASLYSASLRNGDYGGGFIVDTFTSCGDPDGSSCGDGNLSNIGITDSADGVLYSLGSDNLRNAVINYSIGRDYGPATMNSFRSHGTVSVRFNANLQTFLNGQPFTDNYGFNQFNSGQGTFGTAMSRNSGADGQAGTADDRVQITWNTWYNNVWTTRQTGSVLLTFDEWNYLGFAWDDLADTWEIWVNGVRVSLNNGVVPWGSAAGLGNPYNFALGMIHQRAFTPPGSPAGVTFADLNIWDEYRPLGGTQAPPAVPEPAGLALLGLGMAILAATRRRTP